MIWYYVIVIVFGAIVGSFANVVAYRLNSGRTIFSGRSRCDSCGEELKSHHLVPIFSFLFSRGRCRMCGSKIGVSHLISEIVLASIFGYLFFLFGISIQFFLGILFFTLLTSIVIYDLRHTIIPNTLVYPLIGVGAVSAYVGGDVRTLFAALAMSVLFGLIWLLSRGRAMGFGDAKLVFALALFVGFPLSITGFMLSFWIGAVISVTLLVIQGKRRTMGTEVPFAPYLAIGFLCAYLLQLNLLPSVFF